MESTIPSETVEAVLKAIVTSLDGSQFTANGRALDDADSAEWNSAWVSHKWSSAWLDVLVYTDDDELTVGIIRNRRELPITNFPLADPQAFAKIRQHIIDYAAECSRRDKNVSIT